LPGSAHMWHSIRVALHAWCSDAAATLATGRRLDAWTLLRHAWDNCLQPIAACTIVTSTAQFAGARHSTRLPHVPKTWVHRARLAHTRQGGGCMYSTDHHAHAPPADTHDAWRDSPSDGTTEALWVHRVCCLPSYHSHITTHPQGESEHSEAGGAQMGECEWR
jgi:hypothetical protein